MKIEFTILGNPKALKRHRTYTKGEGGRPLPFPMQVDPSKADKGSFLAMSQQYAPPMPLDWPLALEVSFYFKRPKDHYRTGKFSHELKPDAPYWHTSTPDCDNLVKFICDALNTVFWKDDSRVCRMIIFKEYSDKPRTEISIKKL